MSKLPCFNSFLRRRATNLLISEYVDSHLRPFRCKAKSCVGVQFSSTTDLLRHEREAHGMHGHDSKPHLCTYADCERSLPGNGFSKRYYLFDHMKRVHDYAGSTSPPEQVSPPVQPAQPGPRRHNSTHKRKLAPRQQPPVSDSDNSPAKPRSHEDISGITLGESEAFHHKVEAPQLDDGAVTSAASGGRTSHRNSPIIRPSDVGNEYYSYTDIAGKRSAQGFDIIDREVAKSINYGAYQDTDLYAIPLRLSTICRCYSILTIC